VPVQDFTSAHPLYYYWIQFVCAVYYDLKSYCLIRVVYSISVLHTVSFLLCPNPSSNYDQRGEWESQSRTKFGRKTFIGWKTCFGPSAGPSLGLEEISYEETMYI
jgi:hypothetical protein